MKRRQFIRSIAGGIAGGIFVAAAGIKIDEGESFDIDGALEIGDRFTISKYYHFYRETLEYDDSRLQVFEVTGTDNDHIRMKALA